MDKTEEDFQIQNGTKIWFNAEGQIHRENGPAKIYRDGGEVWMKNGLIHREDGPAKIRILKDNIKLERWYLNGKMTRTDGPAYIRSDGFKRWHIDNDIHRDNAPAVYYPDGTIAYYEEGRVHRDNGPAIISPDYDAWFTRGKIHRINAPAIISKKGKKIWCNNARLHREDGPAIEHPDGCEEWWWHGILHREKGYALIPQKDYFIYFISGLSKRGNYKLYGDPHRFLLNKIAIETAPLEEIESFDFIERRDRDNNLRKYKTYKYLGRGKRILTKQSWFKGDFLDEEKILSPEYEKFIDKKNLLPSSIEL